MRLLILLILLSFQASNASKIDILNECNHNLFIVVVNSDTESINGFFLESEDSHTIEVGSNWNGNIMARTGCHEPNATSCNTGFCGPSIDCTMKKISEFKKPFTTAEFQLGSTGSHIYTSDRYAVHLNNGYNRDISIKPTSGTFTKKDEISNWCKEIEMCKENLLYPCPDKMRVRLNNYDTIGCHTSCTKKMYSKRVCDTNGYLDPSYASFFENQEDEEKRIHSDVLSFYADKCPHYVNYGDKSSEESKYYFCTGKNENTNADYQVTICGENQP